MNTTEFIFWLLLVAIFSFTLGILTTSAVLADTEVIQIYDYGTGTFSQETITRERGRVDVQGYNYGTGTHYQYQGDSDGGQGYNYGSGSFTDTYGNPYGIIEE